VPEGRACGNCAFYNEDDIQGDKAWCERWDDYVSGAYYCNAWQPREDEDDDEDDEDDQEERAPIDPDGYMPTEAMQAEAKRGLDWRAEFGRGGTLVGVARARDIVNGRNLPFETVVRMRSYFARHEVDKQGQGFNTGEDGYPSAGRIAWALWGGDAGKRWADNIVQNAERKEQPKMAIEYRQFQTEIRAEGDGHTFTGYAAIFNSEAEGLSTREIIKPGAFSKSVAAAERGDWEVKALQDHDAKYFLGSTKTGTLNLEEDDRGLKVRVSLNPEVTFASDLAAMLRRDGAAMGMSFGFSVPNKGDTYNENGVRELRNIRLHEVSLLTGNQPAYPATIGLGAVRSLSERTEIDASTLMRAFDALLAGAPDADSAATLDLAIRKISPDLRPEPETTTEPEEADERLVPLSVRERQLALAKLEQQIR
jgi:HK97 family phage prohead protease